MRAVKLGLLSVLFGVLAFGQAAIRDPRWRTVGVGTLAARPATCTTNLHVYICNGAGCVPNGSYYYCTATNTWTLGSAGGTISSGTADTVACYSTATNITSCGTATDGFIWNPTLIHATIRNDGLGATPTLGFRLQNQTAAAAGAQQYSPYYYAEGQGWKTNATAASQKVEWRWGVVPVEGAAAPQASLDFWYAINGGAFATTMSLLNDKVGIGTTVPTEGKLQVSGGGIGIDNGQYYRAARNSGGTYIDVLGFDSGTNDLFLRTGGASSASSFRIRDTSNTDFVTILNGTGSIGMGPGNTSPTGTLHVYDATAVTGVTTQTIRTGAGQGTTNAFAWQNNAGNPLVQFATTTPGPHVLLTVNTYGLTYGTHPGAAYRLGATSDDVATVPLFSRAIASQTASQQRWLDPSSNSLADMSATANLGFSSGNSVAWSASATDSTAAKDTGIARNAAGIRETNSGIAGKWGHDKTGVITLQSLAVPGASTVTPTCVPGVCNLTWTYTIVAVLADGTTTTEAGAAGSTALQNGTLDASNFNTLTWAAVTGATSYKVYRTVSAGTPASLGLIGSPTAATLVDNGLAGDASTAPVLNQTGMLKMNLATPTASANPCTAGNLWFDANFIYACTASGVIKRVAIATW